MPRITLRRAAIAAAAVTTAVVLAGCGPAPWSQGQGGPSASASAPATVAPPVPNDLSSGSTKRALQAGAVAASIDYWSDLSMDKWTASAVKPVTLSMMTTVTPDDGKGVWLQRATMLATPGNATGSLTPLEPQIDSAPVQPGYYVLSPSSYSQTFNVGPVPADSTFVTIQFTYEFLVQTTPTSSQYSKQTASETLTVAIAQPAAK